MEDQYLKDVLIVVPYRDRAEHLEHLLKYSPLYFKGQNLTFDFLLCELEQSGDWNAGLTSNSLIKFKNYKNYKWLFIHHVDIWPTEGEWVFPEDGESFCRLGDYGSCLMSMKDFLEVGGYSNNFWGWGGEDNDLYQRLNYSGVNGKDCSNHVVKFDTRFQNHARNFNGQNYAGGIKVLMTGLVEKSDIYDFDNYAEVKDFKQISENIFYHKVVPKKVSPSDFKCNKVIISYVENQRDFLYACAFVKSACIYSAYEYDIVIVVGDESPDDYYVNQLIAHGAKVIVTKKPLRNIHVERFSVYKEIIEQNKQYKHILHVDFSDIYFQDNPFKHLKEDKLTFTTEDLPIEDEGWNSDMIKSMYGDKIYENIKQNYTICSGVIGGPRELFLQLCEKINNESKLLIDFNSKLIGADQPMVNKMIYFDKLFEDQIYITKKEDLLSIHLHVYAHYPKEKLRQTINIENKIVTNSNREKFSIVHQYNRHLQLYNNVTNHFSSYFTPA